MRHLQDRMITSIKAAAAAAAVGETQVKMLLNAALRFTLIVRKPD
jgi:hypothetical protein